MVTPILKNSSLANRAGQRNGRARHAALALLLIALACGDTRDPIPADQATAAPTKAQRGVPTPLLVGNQLRNPGFEAGTEGWKTSGPRKYPGFEVVSEPVHAGNRAAHIVASWQPGEREKPVSVRSATQEISPPRFPDRITGWYRVDRWEYTSDEDPLQLQIIVVAIGDPRTREIVESDEPYGPNSPEVPASLDNYQFRYLLAGPTEEPEDGGNVRSRVIGDRPPDLGSWLHFDLPVKSDFEQRWGSVPANFRQLRIMFLVRWDDKEEGAAVHADVYYDDLFFGFDDL